MSVTLALSAGAYGCGDDLGPESSAAPEASAFILPSLPFPAGTTMGVSQGWDSAWTHTGPSSYALDFDLPGSQDRAVHVVAVADGRVVYRYDGCECEQCGCNSGWGNTIVIRHGRGLYSKYAHLAHGSIPASLQEGSVVCRGLYLGAIGSTGNSTGPHLHFQLQSSGHLNGDSVAFEAFAETEVVPSQEHRYRSENVERWSCPEGI